MKTSYPLVITQQFQKEAIKWMTAIKRRENVMVTFFPKTDRLIRIQQFIDDHKKLQDILKDKSKYTFQVLEFTLHNIEGKQDLYNAISHQLNHSNSSAKSLSFDGWMKYFKQNKVNLVLIIPQIEKLWSVEGHAIQTALSYMLNELVPFVTILSFAETDITHPTIHPYLSDSMRLYENIFSYPLYQKQDAIVFMKYLEHKWSLQLKDNIRNRVFKDCGGQFWLLKEAIRQCDADSFPMYPGEGLKFRINIIYKNLLNSEQSVIRKMIRHKKDLTIEEQHSFNYLKKMRFFDEKGICTIKLFIDYLNQIDQTKTKLVLQENHLILNQVPIEKFFSRKEYRVIKILIEKQGEIVTRDEIARFIWPTNTEKHYSDWAIDQLIARTRRRLAQLSLSPKLLQSIRGKGYLLKLV